MEAQVRKKIKVKRFELNRTIFRFREDGIVHIIFKKNQTIDLEDFHEGIELIRKTGKGKKFLYLYEPDENSDITPELRKYASSDKANKYTIADAIVVNRLSQKIIANFYLKFHKPVKPTAVFLNKKEAIKWLLAHKK